MNSVNPNIPIASPLPTWQELDLATLMFMVQSGRAELLDEMVRDQAEKIRYNNERLKELNQAMSEVNQYGESGGTALGEKITALDLQTGETSEMSVGEFLRSRDIALPKSSNLDNLVEGGITLPPEMADAAIYTKEEIALITASIKNSIDSLTSSSQLDMTQLQATMNKYNQTFEALTNFISKYNQTLSSIIGNLR